MYALALDSRSAAILRFSRLQAGLTLAILRSLICFKNIFLSHLAKRLRRGSLMDK